MEPEEPGLSLWFFFKEPKPERVADISRSNIGIGVSSPVCREVGVVHRWYGPAHDPIMGLSWSCP